MRLPNTFKIALLAAGSALLMSTPTGLADEIADFAQFSTAAEVSSVNVDYRPIKQFTDAFGDEQRGRMKLAYAAIEQQGESFMATYMGYLATVPVSTLSRNDQLAFWLNTRNMVIADAMTDSRSRRRMSSARGTVAEPGEMWLEKRISIEGTELSIQDIEKNIILANFSDNPNIIFGLYQGVSGGPQFPARGFTAANLEAELEAAGREYLGSRNGVKIRRSKVQTPAIYDWYASDVFGGDTEAAKAHLVSLLDADDATKFNAASQFSTRKFSYSSDELIIRQQTNQNVGGGGGGGSFGGGGGGGGGGGS